MLSFSAYAQRHTVSGYVRDVSNGESLIGATVYDFKTRSGTIANNFGFYSLAVAGDSARLTYSFVGFNSTTISFPVKKDTSIVVLLQGGRVLNEVVVRGDYEKIHESTRTGTINLPVSQIKGIPTFAGEQDVLKSLQLLPGVSGGNEGQSSILVRGGSPDQTLILMDGVPIYNPTHLYGMYSSFNPDAVNNVEVVKSGFPARYGGRLSGIADITLREGNTEKFSGSATAGLLASRILLEGPIIKNKTSFLVSGRASYLSLIRPLMEEKFGSASLEDYKFYDLNAKVNHKFNSRNRLYASFYSGLDMMKTFYSSSTRDSVSPSRVINRTVESTDKMGWKNLLTSIRWNHEITPSLFFNATVYLSSYDLYIKDQTYSTESNEATDELFENFATQTYKSSIQDLGVKIDFDHIPNTKHYIRYGATAIQHRFVPAVAAGIGTQGFSNREPVNTPVDTKEANAYFEDDVTLTPKLKMNAGIHGVLYSVENKTYTGIQPRLSLRYALTDRMSIKGSYSYMQQFLQTLTNGGMGMPTELWVPSTRTVKPQSSHQVSIGASQTLDHNIEISAEAFYKTMANVLEYEEGASYADNDEPWFDKVEAGKGLVYGMELFLQKRTGRLTGFVGYSLSWNKRQFDNINNGAWFYYRFDRRHDFKATMNYQLNDKRFDVSATWVYATGNAVTVPVGHTAALYGGVYGIGYPSGVNALFALEFQARNNYRMQPYHRLDLNLNYTFQKQKFEHKLSIGVYNAYSRLNPFYLTYDSNRQRMKSVSLFPIMPSLSYSFKF